MFGIPFLSPKVIAVIVLALAVTAILGYVYHLGGEAPRAELAALKANIEAATKAHAAENARKEGATKTLVTTLETKHAQDLRDVAAGWAGFHADELRRLTPSVAGGRPEPSRIETGVCGDADKDHRLSDQIESYRRAARSSLARCEGAARQSGLSFGELLEGAQRESATLAECTAYVDGIDRINTQIAP